ncbi:DUF397 domain-containing protein (plasmid) [Kribbella sp. WER1]
MTDLAKAVWRKSSRSNNTQNCVEVAHLSNGGFAVRDSKQGGTGPVLQYTMTEWEAFIAGVKLGEFDSRQRRTTFRAFRAAWRRMASLLTRRRRGEPARSDGPTAPDA